MTRLMIWAAFLGLLFGQVNVAGAEDPHRKSLAAGLEHLAQGEFCKAYDLLFVRFQEDPRDLETNFYLGKAAYGKGDYEAAVMAFERVLILAPAATEIKVELAKSFYRLGSIETAAFYFAEALEGDLSPEIRMEIQEFLTNRPEREAGQEAEP